MNWPWVVWGFSLSFLAIASFAWLEARAFRNPEKQHTLSRAVWLLSTKFPLSIAAFNLVLGLLIGALSTHFLWHWCPEIMPSGIGG